MDLSQYALLAVSVAATLLSLALIAGLVVGVYLFKRLTRIADQADQVSKVALETTNSLHNFVEKTTERATGFMEAFMTIRGASEVASQIGQALFSNTNKKITKRSPRGR